MNATKPQFYSIAGVMQAIKQAYPDPEAMLQTFIIVNWIDQDMKGSNRSPDISDIMLNYERYSVVSPLKAEESKRHTNVMFNSLMMEINEKFIKDFISARESLTEKIVWTCKLVKQVAAYFQVTDRYTIEHNSKSAVEENTKAKQ